MGIGTPGIAYQAEGAACSWGSGRPGLGIWLLVGSPVCRDAGRWGYVRLSFLKSLPNLDAMEKTPAISLLVAIVTDDVSDRALDIAHGEGISGVTMVPASGIGNPPIKTFFGLTFQSPMTILFWIADGERANRAARKLRDELRLDSPRQGLALTLPVDQLHGLRLQGPTDHQTGPGEH